MISAIVDSRMPIDMQKRLGDFADRVLPLPPCPYLPSPVSSHPDMLIWVYGKTVLTYSSYRKTAHAVFKAIEDSGYEIREVQEAPSQKYPHDVPLNCAVLGKKLIANTKTVSMEIIRIANQEGLETLHTNQGYAKCATAVLSDNALISADASVIAAAEKGGIDALRIGESGVALDGYDRGFIGGASGYTSGKLLFCGNLSQHPDSQAISDFCHSHGVTPISLSQTPLYDFGTVIFI